MAWPEAIPPSFFFLKIWLATGGRQRAASKMMALSMAARLAADLAVQRLFGSPAQDHVEQMAYRKRAQRALGRLPIVDPVPLPIPLQLTSAPKPQRAVEAKEPLALPAVPRVPVPIVPIHMLGGTR